MKDELNRTRETLKSVTVDGGHSFAASMTEDLDRLVVHDVPRDEVTTMERQEATSFNAKLSDYGESSTIIVGKMTMTDMGVCVDMTAPILCIYPYCSPSLHHKIGDVYVSTSYVGGDAPHLNVGDIEDVLKKISMNQAITLQPKHCDPLEHGDWYNGPLWPLGQDLKFNRMVTIMPVHRMGLDGIKAVRERVDALLVLLTLLNGGRPVGVDDVEVQIAGQHNPPDQILLPTRTWAALESGMHVRGCEGGLRSIGMEGVKRWVDWYAQFPNRTILDRLVFSSHDSLNSISALEGIGRRLLRDSGVRGDVKFGPAVRKVIEMCELEQVIDGSQVDALNRINNKIIKHIGDLTESEDKEYRKDVEFFSMLATELAGHAILRWALGDLTATWSDSWQDFHRFVLMSDRAPPYAR